MRITTYDRTDFLDHTVPLAQELWASGIRAMKIWPFDPIASQTRGQEILENRAASVIMPDN